MKGRKGRTERKERKEGRKGRNYFKKTFRTTKSRMKKVPRKGGRKEGGK